MKPLSEITLNHDWDYLFTENWRTDYSTLPNEGAVWIPLPNLADWAVGAAPQAGADWFRRKLMVDSVDQTTQYILRIERVPERVSIYVNGQHIDDVPHSCSLSRDITRALLPGENIIALKVTSRSDCRGGVFGDVRLQPVAV